MKVAEYVSGHLNESEQAEGVPAWQEHRDSLVAALGDVCTQVRHYQIREADQDIRPHQFIRKGVDVFVWPPQQVTPAEDRSDDIDLSPGYELRLEDVRWGYDPTLVKGKVRVGYDDSDGRIVLSVSDMHEGSSQLPLEASDAIAHIQELATQATAGIIPRSYTA